MSTPYPVRVGDVFNPDGVQKVQVTGTTVVDVSNKPGRELGKVGADLEGAFARGGSDWFEAARAGDIDPTTDELLYETSKPVRIDFLAFATDDARAGVRVSARTSNGQWIPISQPRTDRAGNTDTPRPATLPVGQATGLWEAEDIDGVVFISLRRPLSFPYGVRVEARSLGGETPRRLDITLFGRMMDV